MKTILTYLAGSAVMTLLAYLFYVLYTRDYLMWRRNTYFMCAILFAVCGLPTSIIAVLAVYSYRKKHP